jgi:hypothetical protein
MVQEKQIQMRPNQRRQQMSNSYENITSIDELIKAVDDRLANVRYAISSLDQDVLIALENEKVLVRLNSKTFELKDGVLSFEYDTFNLDGEGIELEGDIKLKVQDIIYDIILTHLLESTKFIDEEE